MYQFTINESFINSENPTIVQIIHNNMINYAFISPEIRSGSGELLYPI